MKKYTIHFRGQKVSFNIKSPHSPPKLIAEWEDTIQSNAPVALWHLTDFAYPKCGIPGAHFYHDLSQPGLFVGSRPENRLGQYSSKGNYLVEVRVQITMSKNLTTTQVGTLGTLKLPS
jgi:hypothetical protein